MTATSSSASSPSSSKVRSVTDDHPTDPWPFTWSPPAPQAVPDDVERVRIVDLRGLREGFEDLARSVDQCREGLTAFTIEAEREID